MGIKIIGTSHISQQSSDQIEKEVKAHQPDIIAIELDVKRALALSNKGETRRLALRDASKIGFKGYIFARVGQFMQKRLGEMVGVKPGSEMKTALRLAYKNKISIALIDQPIEITLNNFSRELTWKEKLHFVSDIFRGVFFRKREIKRLGLDKLDLSKVPTDQLVEKLVDELKVRYPNIHKTLVADRNKFMSQALLKIQTENPGKDILAIVGAGHKHEMINILRKGLAKVDIKPYGKPWGDEIKHEDLG
ncbi:MAG: TraB/GumN family protein [archaeon]|nr:TraB/GumN family protein [Nanoarchaeota archaeon]